MAAPLESPPAATDLLIVGGGPAGLATAIRARLAGLTVRVLDRGRPPIDKACGEGLMPDAVLRLRELDVDLAEGASRRLAGIRYIDGAAGRGGGAGGGTGGGIVAEGALPAPGGLGVRRLDLHRALVARAVTAGVDLRWGCAAAELVPAPQPSPSGPSGRPHEGGQALRRSSPAASSGFSVAGVLAGVGGDRQVMPARWVIGADGLHSQVRRWAGLAMEPAERAPVSAVRRFGVRRHFDCAPWTDLVEVYWGDGCEAYVTPVGPRQVGVALLWWADPGVHAGHRHDTKDDDGHGKTSFDSLLARFPALAARLAGAAPLSRDRGAGPLRQRVAAVCRGNVALIGDAAGYFDAITGEGLAVALHQSAALVAAIVRAERAERADIAAGTPGHRRASAGASPLAAYAAAHRRIVRLPDVVTGLMLAVERRPWLRRRAMRALAKEPALFDRLLGIHARALPPRRLGIDGTLRLVYRLVVA